MNGKSSKIPKFTVVFLIIALLFLVMAGINVKNSDTKEIIGDVKTIEKDTLTDSLDNEEIIISGTPEIRNYPVDDYSGITAEGYILVRTVEMCQYYITESDNVKSDYFEVQHENVIGNGGEEYKNPVFPEDLQSTVIIGDVYIGNIKLGADYLYTLTGDYEYFSQKHNLSSLPDAPSSILDGKYNLNSDGWYVSGDYPSYEIGDIRIKYSYLPENSLDKLTVTGTLNGDTLGGESNYEKAVMVDDLLTADEVASLVSKGSSNIFVACIFMAVLNVIAALVAFLIRNKKLKKQAVASAIAALLVCSILTAPVVLAKADFGDFGGDSDYGYDSGGYDSYDYGGYDSYDYDDDDDYYTTYKTYYYHYDGYPAGFIEENYARDLFLVMSTSGNYYDVSRLSEISEDNSGNNGLLGLIIAGIFGGSLFTSLKKKKKRPTGPVAAGATGTDASTLNPIDDYKNIDPSFDSNEFENKLSDMYVKFQKSWQNKDLFDLREYITDEFYAQMEGQLDNYLRHNQTNIIENIVVENVLLKGWKQDGENDIMIAELVTCITDYVISDDTGEVIRGDKNARKLMRYEWSLVRKTGETTGHEHEESVCPNCGAPLSLNSASQCEYCGSVITTSAKDWALNSIKGLAQRTLSN